VVIYDSDLGRVAVGPSEDHPPLVVDPDRIETFEVASRFSKRFDGGTTRLLVLVAAFRLPRGRF